MVTAGSLLTDPTTCFIPDLFIGSMKETSELTIMLEYEVRIYASLMMKPLMMGNGKPCPRYEFT